MTPHYTDATVTLYAGDCIDVLAELPDASVDAVVTDPPYGLEFMGKTWDAPWQERDVNADAGFHGGGLNQTKGLPSFTGSTNPKCATCKGTRRGRRDGTAKVAVCLCDDGGHFPNHRAVEMRAFGDWCELWTAECLRVLKPGGHLLAFGGTRTWHRLACAVEDAGFEVRDSIAWLYGSGFPKSLDVSKAIDKTAGAEREVVGTAVYGDGHIQNSAESIGYGGSDPAADLRVITAPATPDAARWQGFGTAMKPAHEPVLCARKPLSDMDILDRMGSHLDALEYQCRRLASGAVSSSAPTPPSSPAARTSTAPASVATQPGAEPESSTPTGVAADSSAATATSVSAWMDETFSSTVTSWRECWAEIYEATSTSTTSTATSRTTDLTTLSSCLSSITRSVTEQSTPDPDSLRSLVEAADNLFAAGVLSSRSTRALSAIESATSETRPTSPDAEGSSPAFEPVVVARKPLRGTVAGNVLAHGTGALNIDGCRIGDGGGTRGASRGPQSDVYGDGLNGAFGEVVPGLGRWPANVVLSEDQAAALDQQSGTLTSGANPTRRGADGDRTAYGDFGGQEDANPQRGGDIGGASRFFFVSRKDESCSDESSDSSPNTATTGSTTGAPSADGASSTALPVESLTSTRSYYTAKAPTKERPRIDGIGHPTIKPLDLMRWLVRLVTPPGGTILEPFAGSGTTVEAAILEGFNCIAIEREPDYLPLITQRINRRRDPVAAVKASGDDGGLFDLLDGGAA